MPRKLRSSFARSLLLHGALLLMIALLVYHPHSDEAANPPIIIENISLGKEVKRAIHTVVHSIGLPHTEPESSEDPEESTVTSQQDLPSNSEASPNISSEAGAAMEGSEMQRYLAGVVSRINERKRYPKAAQFREQEGLVKVLLEVSPEGRVLRAEVETACPFPLLNEAALDAVRAMTMLPPLPASHSAKSIVLHVPIHFKIER